MNLLTALITILHIGILIGLGASIGTLAGFVLSFTSMSYLIGGIIASTSMLSASAISDTIRYYSQNDYVDIIIPDINPMTETNLEAIGFKSPINNFIKISAYFAIGAGLVAFGFCSYRCFNCNSVFCYSYCSTLRWQGFFFKRAE